MRGQISPKSQVKDESRKIVCARRIQKNAALETDPEGRAARLGHLGAGAYLDVVAMKIVQVVKPGPERGRRDPVGESERGEQGRRLRDVALESSARPRLVVVNEFGRVGDVALTPTDQIVAPVD